ncbi:MAG TPA: hypothetical protein ENI96_13455 [Sedimenticola thiotaurini]|uniref:Uncharacterized protein n=1 Tax=Sedimenticola thiotaurini TaxID=1543721 RepID=A0A831RPP0_9GAMM|nr:hypothetical protein [Sedimenticola thiotaurini]
MSDYLQRLAQRSGLTPAPTEVSLTVPGAVPVAATAPEQGAEMELEEATTMPATAADRDFAGETAPDLSPDEGPRPPIPETTGPAGTPPAEAVDPFPAASGRRTLAESGDRESVPAAAEQPERGTVADPPVPPGTATGVAPEENAMREREPSPMDRPVVVQREPAAGPPPVTDAGDTGSGGTAAAPEDAGGAVLEQAIRWVMDAPCWQEHPQEERAAADPVPASALSVAPLAPGQAQASAQGRSRPTAPSAPISAASPPHRIRPVPASSEVQVRIGHLRIEVVEPDPPPAAAPSTPPAPAPSPPAGSDSRLRRLYLRGF